MVTDVAGFGAEEDVEDELNAVDLISLILANIFLYTWTS